MVNPVISEGSISGVNWILLKDRPTDFAMELAMVVFPIPGTSSIRICPEEARAMTISLDGPSLPIMTRDMFFTIFLMMEFFSFIKTPSLCLFWAKRRKSLFLPIIY
jgi:hypothetical protein